MGGLNRFGTRTMSTIEARSILSFILRQLLVKNMDKANVLMVKPEIHIVGEPDGNEFSLSLTDGTQLTVKVD